jgi:hypothetical protein
MGYSNEIAAAEVASAAGDPSCVAGGQSQLRDASLRRRIRLGTTEGPHHSVAHTHPVLGMVALVDPIFLMVRLMVTLSDVEQFNICISSKLHRTYRTKRLGNL